MLNTCRCFLLCAIAVLLAACTEKPEAAKPNDHVWNTQTRALEKARAVEQQVLDAAAERDRVIDAQSQ